MPDDLLEAHATRLSWREQLAALPRAFLHRLLCLVRCEHRYYLTIDGKVAARFTSAADYHDFVRWLTGLHVKVYDLGIAEGGARCERNHPTPDAGPDRPS
jgi:hypothetical protein